MVGTLNYGHELIRYEVSFLPNRRTLSIEVHPDSRVLVRAPFDCPPAVIAERVRKRARWISRQLAQFERYRPRTPARQYVSGESHLYLGRQYRLRLQQGEVNQVALTRGQLLVSLPGDARPDEIKACLHRWYVAQARRIFSEVLHEWAARLSSHSVPRLAIRTMRSRWGSLSTAGTVTLNLNLIKAPRRCIEYVVVHELCHLQHRNHDRRFVGLLSKWMPDWPARKRQLEQALL